MVKFKLKVLPRKNEDFQHLHSNMVKFKYNKGKQSNKIFEIYIPIWLNSNNIVVSLLKRQNKIYIPIWLNSNTVELSTPTSTAFIYIPIWLNSNEEFNENDIEYALFTFQYG